MYVISRKDLDKFGQSYKYVQGMHAVSEYLLNYQTNWENGTIVALGIDDIFKLEFLKNKLKSQNIIFSEFYEPDINNELTAIACVSDGKMFKHLKLL